MSMLVWVMMGIAIWHFAVWVPDRFRGGIVGAFIAAVIGSAVVGFVAAGFSIPGQDDTHLVQALVGAAGAAVALAVSWFWGDRVEPERPEVP
jgi:uncharacterized membrane protein YeaQ/YmgE (transglycosylase-associated protein family)